ncbi:MAG: acyloxyacyl hydrolase [Terracidiphilus sp.]
MFAPCVALLTHLAIGQGYATPPSSNFFHFRDPADFNRNIYYKNKLEFSLETGWLPNNIPFPFNFVVGDSYITWPLHYTLVPNIASIRWHVDNIDGRGILRGNLDLTFSGTYTAIPRGPESRYFAFVYGMRRNFIQRNWRIVPYFEARGGVGNINAKGPDGVLYAQGQDLSFTLMMGSGARYNFSPRFSLAAGMAYDHISNFYLSQSAYNYGLNVYGSFIGINVRIGKEKRLAH